MAQPRATSSQELGHYSLRKKLGAGAMGEVWLARDKFLDRQVAIKVLHAGASDERRVKDFLREAQAAAKLNHPNTVTIHQIGKAGDKVYIAMEYVEGGSLADELEKKGALPWREATQAIRDAAAGLRAAHEQGVIHRDIKPSNLMRSSSGLVKVADFGLAKALDGNSAMTMTQPGMVLGSPAYMSPEQCRGESADARSDIYSLICAYYQLLTRKIPFAAVEATAAMYMHCHEPFPDVRQSVRVLPEGVWHILDKGSRKRPEERYQTAAELLADLDDVLLAPEPLRQVPDATATPKDKTGAGSSRMGSILRGKGIMGKTTWAVVLFTLAWLSFSALRGPAFRPEDSINVAGLKPAPTLAAQYKAEQTIKNIFKDEYAQHTPAGRQALALKLLVQGQQNNDDPVMRFVLLREARDLAALAGNTTVAFQAVDESAKGYTIDAVDAKTAAFMTASLHIASQDDARGLSEAGLDLLDQSVATDHYVDANRLGPVVEAAAGKTKDIPLLSKVQARNRQVADLRREFEKQRAAFDALRKNPADADANLAVGRYLCFLKNNWGTGLPMLAMGADSGIKDLAAKELTNPADPAVQLRVADEWWAQGAKQDQAAKGVIERHAATWYQKAFPTLSSAEQARILGRLPVDSPPPVASVTPAPSVSSKLSPPAALSQGEPPVHLDAEGHRVLDLMPLIDVKRGHYEGTSWTKVGHDLIASKDGTIPIPYEPAEEYDYVVQFSFTSDTNHAFIGQYLASGGHAFAWRMGDQFFGFDSVNGKGFTAPENPTRVTKQSPFLQGKRYEAAVRVRSSGVSAYLDGQAQTQYTTNFTDLRIPQDQRNRPEGLGLELTHGSIVVFHKVEIVEIRGKGHQAVPPSDDPLLVRSYVAPEADFATDNRTVFFTPDGRHVVQMGQCVTAWERNGGNIVLHQPGENGPRTSPNGQFFVYTQGHAAFFGEIGKAARKLEGSYVWNWRGAAVSPNGNQLVIANGVSPTKELITLDTTQGNRLKQARIEHTSTVLYSPDGLSILRYSGPDPITYYTAQSLTVRWTNSVAGGSTFASFSRDGTRIVVGAKDPDIRLKILDAADGKVVASSAIFPASWNRSTVDPLFSPDGHSILAFSRNGGPIAVFDPASGAEITRFNNPIPDVVSADWSPDGKRVLVGCKDGKMRLLDFATGSALQTFGGHDGTVWAVAFSFDGKFVASGCNDNIVRVFRIAAP